MLSEKRVCCYSYERGGVSKVPACGEKDRFHAFVEQAVGLDIVSNVESNSLSHSGVFDTEIKPLSMPRGVDIIVHVEVIDVHVTM